MLATGTYKVWGTDPNATAPDPNSKPAGFLIIAENDGDSMTRYWVPHQNPVNFPFVSDASVAYWIRRSDEPEGVNDSIQNASLDIGQTAPVIHDWGPWQIEVGGNTAGAAISHHPGGPTFSLVTASANQFGLPIEIDANTWFKLTPIDDQVDDVWLTDFMNSNFQPGSWSDVEQQLTIS